MSKNLTKKQVTEQIDHIIESEMAEDKLIQEMYEDIVEQERIEIIGAKINVLKELYLRLNKYNSKMLFGKYSNSNKLIIEMVKELKDKLK